MLLVSNRRDVIERQRMNPARQVLQLDIEISSVSNETAKCLSTFQSHSDQLIARSNLGVRLQQRFTNLVDGHFPSYIREIRAKRTSHAESHMAGTALPLAEKQLLSGRAIARHGGF